MDGDSVVGRLKDERGKRAKDDGLGPALAGFIDFIGGGCCTWSHFGRTKEGRCDERGLGDSDARLSGRRSVLAGERHEAESGRERRTEPGRTHVFGARGASIANGRQTTRLVPPTVMAWRWSVRTQIVQKTECGSGQGQASWTRTRIPESRRASGLAIGPFAASQIASGEAERRRGPGGRTHGIIFTRRRRRRPGTELHSCGAHVASTRDSGLPLSSPKYNEPREPAASHSMRRAPRGRLRHTVLARHH